MPAQEGMIFFSVLIFCLFFGLKHKPWCPPLPLKEQSLLSAEVGWGEVCLRPPPHWPLFSRPRAAGDADRLVSYPWVILLSWPLLKPSLDMGDFIGDCLWATWVTARLQSSLPELALHGCGSARGPHSRIAVRSECNKPKALKTTRCTAQ